ncbi:MAG: hypothetical protein KGI50_02990 [Patescibacteria group bacterium]|nr:hypothetical protein [Patescibacteria group bacterium]MDE2438258.1 hypothetical protein [Patescibacteria group bacterium]
MITCTVTSLVATEEYPALQCVTLPGTEGVFQVYPGHAEAFFALQEGNIQLRHEDGTEQKISANGGECYINHDHVIVVL